jgi:hypothetical protein
MSALRATLPNAVMDISSGSSSEDSPGRDGLHAPMGVAFAPSLRARSNLPMEEEYGNGQQLLLGDYCFVRCVHNERWYVGRVMENKTHALLIHYVVQIQIFVCVCVDVCVSIFW